MEGLMAEGRRRSTKRLQGTGGGVEHLDLSENQFSGSIPHRYGRFAELSELNLSGNRLSGPAPGSIVELKRLVTLDLSKNHLSGEIPSGTADLPVLSALDLSVNDFSGEIPPGLGKSGLLVSVNVSYNSFQGSVPQTAAFRERRNRRVWETTALQCGGFDRSVQVRYDVGILVRAIDRRYMFGRREDSFELGEASESCRRRRRGPLLRSPPRSERNADRDGRRFGQQRRASPCTQRSQSPSWGIQGERDERRVLLRHAPRGAIDRKARRRRRARSAAVGSLLLP